MEVTKKSLSAISGCTEIANIIPDIIAMVDVDKTYTWMNWAGLEFFGKDAVGRGASYYFEGEQETYDKIKPLFTGESEIYNIDSWQRRKDGQKRLLSWHCKSLKDARGNITGAISVAHDVTESYRMEEKLRSSEKLLDSAYELAHLAPWDYDVVSDQFTFNDPFYAIFKTTVKDIGGYQMSSTEYSQRFVHPDDAELVGGEVKKAIMTGDPHFTRKIVHRFMYADGKSGYMAVRFFVIKDEQGKTVKTFGINQDITEQRNREENLKNMSKELQSNLEQAKKMNELMTGRELKMMELKKYIEKLEKEIDILKRKSV